VLVFGDVRWRGRGACLVDDVRAATVRCGRAARAGDVVVRLDAARDLLVRAGRLEQAAADAAVAARPLARAEQVTDLAAAAFLAAWAAAQGSAGPGWATRWAVGCTDPLDALAGVLDDLAAALGDAALEATTPEGFAFYGLFPEQHLAAAARWCDDHPPVDGGAAVAVVGLRSIGTALSAVVAGVLRARGWTARRSTVRPTGHPWQRDADVSPAAVAGAVWVLVVDEGPGLSGSSMAAVADAAVRAGAPPGGVVLLPGHGGGPGAQAGAAVRARWAATPTVVVAPGELRWAGRDLAGVLAERTAALVRGASPGAGAGAGAAVVGVDDAGGGLWRRAAFAAPRSWPAVSPAFERPKHRARLADGRAVLWRFAGVDAEEVAGVLRRRAELGWGPACLGVAHGHVATWWLPGTPLACDDLDAATMLLLARYVDEVAGRPLAPAAAEAAFERLAAVLRVNAGEALGDEAAAAAAGLASAARPGLARRRPAGGDGHLAPHTWVRAGGRIWKVGGVGPAHEPTVVGRQPVTWDHAALDHEWGTRTPAVAAGDAWLRFHEAAYAGFRLGQLTLGGTVPGDEDRVAAAAAHARRRLAALLGLRRAAPRPVERV
jgi:hypothetical protein